LALSKENQGECYKGRKKTVRRLKQVGTSLLKKSPLEKKKSSSGKRPGKESLKKGEFHQIVYCGLGGRYRQQIAD